MTLATDEHKDSLETDVYFVSYQQWNKTSIKYAYIDALIWVEAGSLMKYLPCIWRHGNTETSIEIRKWIGENVRGACYYNGGGDFYFGDEIEAMAFKLRWT